MFYKVAFLMPLAAIAMATELDREPYLQRLGTESVTVVWRGTTPHSASVFYGKDSKKPEHSEASPVGLQHEVVLSGLEPNTRYRYRVVGPTGALSKKDSYTFKTAPVTGARDPFRMWVVGDSGTGGDAQYRVKDAMKQVVGKDLPDLYLHVGDMAYGSGTDSEFTSRFFLPYQELLSSIPVWPAIGNHEGRTSTSASQTGPYFDAYVLPSKGEVGGLASGTEAYYSFDYGNAHFVVLDSHQSSRKPGDAMLSWLQADLASTEQEWLVAFWHHPPYTKGSHDSDIEGRHIEMRENALPILESKGVDVVFGGHSHIYERSFLLNGAYETPSTSTGILNNGNGDPASGGAYQKPDGLQANSGAVYVVAGHGGGSMHGGTLHPLMSKMELEHGSVLVDVHENRLSIRNIRHDGIVTDVATLIKGSGVQLLWPNGGETLTPGEPVEIRWKRIGNTSPVDVSFSKDNGLSWQGLGTAGEGEDTLSFQVPQEVGDDFRVRVQTSENGTFSDISDGRFSVVAAEKNTAPSELASNSESQGVQGVGEPPNSPEHVGRLVSCGCSVAPKQPAGLAPLLGLLVFFQRKRRN
jgi:MYXO-CTERM domain-containing protein